ncbi:MAG: hypothetical protein RR827_04015, partial [Oscillospiraceae bacterium]
RKDFMCSICEHSICPPSCPNTTQADYDLICPVCGSKLGDETYIDAKSKKIIGCQYCIATVSYSKLDRFY